MKPTPEQVAEDLKVHLEDCASFRIRIEDKLGEAADDIKKLLAFMHKALGFLKALAIVGTIVGTLVAAAGLLK